MPSGLHGYRHGAMVRENGPAQVELIRRYARALRELQAQSRRRPRASATAAPRRFERAVKAVRATESPVAEGDPA